MRYCTRKKTQKRMKSRNIKNMKSINKNRITEQKKRIAVMKFYLAKKISNNFHSNRFFEEVDQKLRFKNQKNESYLGVKSHM